MLLALFSLVMSPTIDAQDMANEAGAEAVVATGEFSHFETEFPLTGAHDQVECSTCHVVPEHWSDPGHIDGDIEVI